MTARAFGIGALTCVLLALVPAGAVAVAERASLQASFSPDRLATPTTISFSFELSTLAGTAPAPLTRIDLRMPAGLNYTTTTLGLALCNPEALVAHGLSGCPANSRLGYGDAAVEVPFGSGAGHEIPEIQAVAGPSKSGNMEVLFYAKGLYPVLAQLAFTGEVLPDSGLFGSQLATSVPLIASVPGGPDVSITRVSTTIGPRHLTYYKRVHGRRVAFTPRGVAVPARCPRGGFPFAASFAFLDGTEASATTTVPCPSRRDG
ncbi:MAG TPA: hypothetical protein VK680_03860 [Solirubrobacteraceae bacterium]|jgi:hypothetical protein|nr:hypothetical protein [Solirubrobacteraceae bacterium]